MKGLVNLEAPRHLYLMLSQTGTGIGKMIRLVTHYDYNHVSLSLDPNFRHWVSFARYVKGVPLAGGFVKESPERFYACADTIPVKIFRIDITESRHEKLQMLFSRAGRSDCGLIYNTFGAMLNSIGLRFPIPGAYTCLEFAELVLDQSHHSIRALDRCYQDHLIFEGDLQELVADSGSRSGSFFTRRGALGGTKDTLFHFLRLCLRVIRHKKSDPLSTSLH